MMSTYRTMRIAWYPTGTPWTAVAHLPPASGFLYRHRTYIQGTTGAEVTLLDNLGVDVLGGGAASCVTGSNSGHLTEALSTTAGAMPRVFAGPLIFQAVGVAGDENGVTELTYAETLDLDESFGLGLCRVERRIVTWTSDSAGAALVAFDDLEQPLLRGVVVAVETLPDVGVPPKDDYDLTLVDTLGQDLSDGLLANRSDTDPEIVYLWRAAAVTSRHQKAMTSGDRLELRVANASSATCGAVGIYLAVPV